MASPAIVRTPLRKTDERNFRAADNRAWVCHLVAEATGQSVGVKLSILFGPFGISPRDYFTSDEGGSFRHAALSVAGNSWLDIELNAPEDNPKTITTLRQVLAMWRAASGHSERRATVRDRCIGLSQLLKSLSQTPILPHLQQVECIRDKSQALSDEWFQEVEEELDALLGRLRAIDAADGEKIISPARHEKFLGAR